MGVGKRERTRRFWKPRRALPSVEWDAVAQKPKFEFVKGFFETDNQELADYLLSKGYEEVGKNDRRPPIPELDDLPDPEATRDQRPAATERLDSAEPLPRKQ